ncbi:MAG: tRNA uridine-5-carboxymethylaminomethyl(34) synthesis enzyme MnmG [bacterium]|nr:tRNA uridine-5-carboxymethylaminomethyl(34) synthesis enzyme MnmG [bacterium]MDT8396549.1 tRNA uridine-5-carboxymethylaminomethyl(34) synthesis enzyme MnmG [bacterium]
MSESSKRFRDPTSYDVVVIGAGHAGCEAAWACARMGMTTLLMTISIDQVAHMSCNPAVGGLAKGHLVKEIDVLGGIMGMAIDATGIQYRILNTKKGPAVRSSRAQADMYGYKSWVREKLEAQECLHIKQGMVEGFLVEEGGGTRKVEGVYTQAGEEFQAGAVVVASGTFLNGLIHIGMTNYPAGRAGEFPSVGLSGSLAALNISLGRLKTGTTPRLDAKTIDFSRCTPQYGDEVPQPFSFRTGKIDREQVPCWITRTSEATHEAIRSGLDRSPLYGGVIKGVGPRYCPSIEDKIVRFPDKAGHHVFLEPEGLQTREYYPNGVSTSLPIDIQIRMLRTIPGLEEVQIMRPGYAIEYDFAHPTQLGADLMVKKVPGLYLAGQINGTSGYEEAGAQGQLAGINAALRVRGEEPFTVGRDEAYMGVMVDDLVTKGVTEPYRLFTSRAEHRLLLREDNADIRLMEKGHRLGLISDDEVEQLREKVLMVGKGMRELGKQNVTVCLAGGPRQGILLKQALKQPDVAYKDLVTFNPDFSPEKRADAVQQIEIQVKYEGYIVRQQAMVEKVRRLDKLAIPEDLDYSALKALSREIRDRLEDIRPTSLGQASRIPGVTPAAVSALMIYIKSKNSRAGE